MIGFFRLTQIPQRMGVKNLVAILCPTGSRRPSNLPGHMERSKFAARNDFFVGAKMHT
jgi:hypothetical protein